MIFEGRDEFPARSCFFPMRRPFVLAAGPSSFPSAMFFFLGRLGLPLFVSRASPTSCYGLGISLPWKKATRVKTGGVVTMMGTAPSLIELFPCGYAVFSAGGSSVNLKH